MFKKPTRRFRARAAESSEEEAGGDGEDGSPRQGETTEAKTVSVEDERQSDRDTGENVSATVPASQRCRVSRDERPLGQGMLSFYEQREEGDEEQFRIKKPAVSAVIFRGKNKIKINTESSDRQSDENKELYQCDHKLNSSSNDECESEDDIELFQCDRKPNSSSNDECESEDNVNLSEDSQHSAFSNWSNSSLEKQHVVSADIPDASIIRAARKKRELARAGGDYIPLDTSGDMQQASSDEDSEDEADVERRIEFAPKPKSLKQRMAEEISSLENNEESEESQNDDGAEVMWEEQQLRKAVKISQGSDLDVFMSRNSHYRKIKREPPVLPPVDLEIIKKRLSARLKSLQEIHRSHEREYEKVVHDIERSKSVISNLEQSSSAVNYKFYNAMKTYVENLADFLSEKISMIDELELAMQQLLQQKAHTLFMRRQDDLRSEAALIQQLTSNSRMVHGSMGDDEKIQLEECESRRAYRRKVRESSELVSHHEGMSSDDEMSPLESTDFQKGRDNILKKCQTIFDDVLEDFCSIKCVLLKFQEWREKCPDSYFEAYISLCLPTLLKPLIRIRLIDWNPFEEYTDLEQASWYQEIKTFICSGNGLESEREGHGDQKVLSTVLMKTVIPKITELVKHVWDPLSSSQTSNLVKLCKNILKECGPSKTTKELLNFVVLRLKKAIDEDVYIPLYPKSALDDKSLPHSKFQERQFWSAVKLLSNILCWDGLIEEEILYEVGLEKLLNRYLLLMLLHAHPEPSNVEKCHKVIECFPERWFKDLNSGSTLPQLSKFSNHLLQSSDAMYNNFRAETSEMVLLLMKIKALDSAEVLIKKYGLENLKSEMKT